MTTAFFTGKVAVASGSIQGNVVTIGSMTALAGQPFIAFTARP